MAQDAARWYAIHTKPRKERHVQACLRSRGVETYLPVLPVPSRRRPREMREEPFFARYLFALLNLQIIPLSSINWSPGVTRVVSFGGQPAVVPDRVIQWLKERLAQEAIGHHKGLPLRPNDRLRVTGGPLKGLEAIFHRHLSSEDRAQVLVDFLGRLTACEIALEWLERVD
ncbi:MAG: transcription termination/antitermination NusG family protein [Anaerolineae bacterium]|nr:transcription termination/antitermination NusG family protein [Anaerolineae bacterium]